ncbi:MAG: hypothetical protein MUC49_21375 [Raineya sp.]|nr:hypothetical protein [Raineya sp.]
MATGVEPLGEEDYDIDVGIIFNILKDEHDPVGIKKVVFDILDAVYQRNVEIKRPCVRVQYKKAGEKVYHIDLAIYSYDKNKRLYIAKGFPGSSSDKKIWEVSEPYQLKELIKAKIKDELDRDQFRRVIRYLKRWKDYNFSSEGTERPTGIALTALCYNLFSVEKNIVLTSSGRNYKYNDLKALLNVVSNILSSFSWWDNTISVILPVKPYNNLFEKMSNNQMLNFKQKLETLKKTLELAMQEMQITKACMHLQGVFGSNFPTS